MSPRGGYRGPRPETKINGQFYWLVKTEHGEWRLEHRLLMAAWLGRPLTDDEIVHHKDGNGLNNDRDNLELTDRIEHNRIHGREWK